MGTHDETERIIFVEFWSGSRRLRPFEAITEVSMPARNGRPAWINYHFYDCAVRKDGVLIYDMSGCGSLVDDRCYVTRGPWWAARGIKVKYRGERRVSRLPKWLNTWPPENSIEARIVECSTCGWVGDEDEDNDEGVCPHMTWDEENGEWIQKEVIK